MLRLVTCALAVLVLAASVFSAELAEIDTSGAVRTAEEAVQRAYQYTGFEEIKSVPQTAAAEMASLTVIENDSTPFLYTQINGRQVWKVQLKDVRLVLPRKPQEYLQQCKPKTFEAWIDAETGILIRIVSRSRHDGYDPNLFPELPPDSATKVMDRMGDRFEGFPTEVPKVDFLEALDLAPGTSPCKAKDIISRYVMWSHMGKPAVAVWYILVQGNPSLTTFRPLHREEPEFFRNRWCAIVDATTGRFLGAGTPVPAAIPDSVREAVKAKAEERNKR